MASFIARLVVEAGGTLPTSAADQFPDDDGAHEPNIDRLAAAGIVTGKADGTYDPADKVKRGQMATLLSRAYQHLSGRQLPLQGTTSPTTTAPPTNATSTAPHKQGSPAAAATATTPAHR